MNKGKTNTKQIQTIVGVLILLILALWMIPNTILSPDRMLDKGEMYQKTGRTALALKIYQKAVEKYPDNYEAHLHLGNALLESDEPELAKQEFNKAVELSGNSKNKFDAQIAMATMLLSENKYDKAEQILLSVQDPKPNKVKRKLAELYIQWGDEKYNADTRPEAVDKYKLAFKNYDGVDVEAQQKIEDKIIKIYNDMSLEFLSKKKIDQAIDVLKQSIEFIDNPSAHIKLADIYNKQNKKDEAIAEYEKAYEIDTTGASALYLGELLVQKGVEYASKNEMDKAKECFEKAQEVNPSIVIPAEILYSVSISAIKTRLTSNAATNRVFPEVSFVITNKGKEKINFLKAKVVFMEEGKVLSKAEKTIASEQDPISIKGSSETINLSSPTALTNEKNASLIQAKVYLAYDSTSDWKFARNLVLSKNKNAFVSNDTTSTSNTNSTPDTTPKKPTASTATGNQYNKPQNTSNTGPAAVENPTLAPLNPVPNNPSAPQPVAIPVQVQPNSSNVELPPIKNE